jgi:5'(3')-deoxyribonucleotidase
MLAAFFGEHGALQILAFLCRFVHDYIRLVRESEAFMVRIAVDMDEVITDALTKHLDLYNEHFDKELTEHDLTGFTLPSFVPDHERERVIAFVEQESFFADMAVLPGAVETLEALSHEHELFITTAAMEFPNSFMPKYVWLIKHLPFITPMNFVFCGDKSIVHADYLIDDNVRHFKRFKGTGLLFEAPHNKLVDYNPRVRNWGEVAEFFSVKPSFKQEAEAQAKAGR